jgi:hypothetical protein
MGGDSCVSDIHSGPDTKGNNSLGTKCILTLFSYCVYYPNLGSHATENGKRDDRKRNQGILLANLFQLYKTEILAEVSPLFCAFKEVICEAKFRSFGAVASVSIIKDQYSGQSRGFGFVEMPSASEAQVAISGLHGKDLKGRTLNVNEARPREGGSRSERRPGGFGGGGGGRRRG